jgi:hypothetical protein
LANCSPSGAITEARFDRPVVGAILSDVGTAQKQLTHADVVPLMRHGMLRRDVKVAHAALQRGAIVNRTSTAKRETGVRYTNANSADPDRGLRAMRSLHLVLQRSGNSVMPMASISPMAPIVCGKPHQTSPDLNCSSN